VRTLLKFAAVTEAEMGALHIGQCPDPIKHHLSRQDIETSILDLFSYEVLGLRHSVIGTGNGLSKMILDF
jgi:hypothetical protein